MGTRTQAFYVFDRARAQAMHRQQTRDATALRLGTDIAASTGAVVPVPGPRWPWLLGFLVVAGLLWWLERRRPRPRGTP